MNAPLPKSVKVSAAQAVINWMQEKVKLVRFFRYNAQTQHGVPQDPEDVGLLLAAALEKNEEEKEPEKEPDPECKPTNVQNVVINETQPPETITEPPTEKQEPDRILPLWWSMLLISGAGVLLVALGTLFGYTINSGDGEKKPAENTEIVDNYKQSGYQYLEDEGGHLPK